MHCESKQATMRNNAQLSRLLLFVVQRKPQRVVSVTVLCVKHGNETWNICKHKQFTSTYNQ
jgi:hypothetical protein